MIQYPPTHALIVVDVQNDFVTGALPVPQGADVVPVVNALRNAFPTVVFTQDWHPANHASFAANHEGRNVFESIDLNGLPQCLWPTHCVQHTYGAAFVPGLNTNDAPVFLKGTDPQIDSYSGFYDNGHRKSTGLGDFLKVCGVTDVFVCGLATDYCVKATAIDAAQFGFNTTLVEDASRGVNLHPDDVAKAIDEMRRAGVHVLNSAEVMNR